MLIGNYCVLNKTPGRWLAGNSTSHATGVGVSAHNGQRGQWNTNGPRRGVHYPDGAETVAYKRIGYPVGGSGSLAWMMPYEQGDLKSYNDCDLTVSASGTGGEGLGFPGTVIVTVNGTALGQLVSQGNGSATVSITASGAVTATLSSPGSATITVTGTLTPGATGWVVAQADVTVDGSLEPYAAGRMVGTTAESGLTVAGITNSVWNAVLSQYAADGTAGKALATASSGGVDLDLMAAAVWDYVNRGLTQEVDANVAKVNGVSVTGTGASGDEWGPA